MKTINVEGLPEPIAQAMEAMARLLREQLVAAEKPDKGRHVSLPTRSGKVLGILSREDIYEDVG
jgi:hypothetical protein